jgi:hypothetical protein
MKRFFYPSLVVLASGLLLTCSSPPNSSDWLTDLIVIDDPVLSVMCCFCDQLLPTFVPFDSCIEVLFVIL